MVKQLLFTLLTASLCFADMPLERHTLVGSGNVAANFTADDTSNYYCFNERVTDVVFYMEATENSGTGTLDVKVQHGRTNAAAGPWVDYTDAVFVQASADSDQTIRINNTYGLLECVNIVVDVGASGSPDYDVLVIMFFNSAN